MQIQIRLIQTQISIRIWIREPNIWISFMVSCKITIWIFSLIPWIFHEILEKSDSSEDSPLTSSDSSLAIRRWTNGIFRMPLMDGRSRGLRLNSAAIRPRMSYVYLDGTGGYEPRIIFSTRFFMFCASNWNGRQNKAPSFTDTTSLRMHLSMARWSNILSNESRMCNIYPILWFLMKILTL